MQAAASQLSPHSSEGSIRNQLDTIDARLVRLEQQLSNIENFIDDELRPLVVAGSKVAADVRAKGIMGLVSGS